MNNNRCVCCGAIIPEGRQVCPTCEKKASSQAKVDYWWNEWILPIGLLAAIAYVFIRIATL